MVKRKLSTTAEDQPTKRRKKADDTSSPTKPKTTQKRKTTKPRTARKKKPAATKKTAKIEQTEKIEERARSRSRSPVAKPKSPKRRSSTYSAKENKFVGAHVSIASMYPFTLLQS